MNNNIKKDMISVIIPTYNDEKYITKCIESVQKQTYQNFEILICDDCSKDNTYRIITELAQKDERIKVIKNEKNSRAAYTRNRCIEIASGEFIAVQDADDYSLENRFEKEINFLKDNPQYDYVATGANIFNSTGIVKKCTQTAREIIDRDFLINLPFTHTSVMIKKDIIQKYGCYRVAKDTVRGQDYDLFIRLQIGGVRGYILNEPLVCYREDIDTFRRRTFHSRIDNYNMRKKYFKQLNIKWYERLYKYRPLIIGLIPIRLQKLLRKISK